MLLTVTFFTFHNPKMYITINQLFVNKQTKWKMRPLKRVYNLSKENRKEKAKVSFVEQTETWGMVDKTMAMASHCYVHVDFIPRFSHK